MKRIITVLIVLLNTAAAYSQVSRDEILRGKLPGTTSTPGNSQQPSGRNRSSAPKKDSLGFERRDDSKDSITITYKFLDSLRSNNLDSTINDFDKYYSVPSYWQNLGNNGNAAFPLIYQPNYKTGWDAGFHAYDLYRFTLAESKFYRTNRPFTQMSYQLASGKEQMIKVFHTQSPKPNLHFGLDYRLISAPGFFLSQNTSHNNYRIFSNYTGKRKRYAAYLVVFSNTIRGGENGGIIDDALLSDKNKKKRFSIPVNMGNASSSQFSPFSTAIAAGNIYKDATFFYRHSYDVGKKDSLIINDSTTEYLFYPKLRLQHTFSYSTYSYAFKDDQGDSTYYKTYYDTTLRKPTDTLNVNEKWKVISNDFSLLQFPDTKNPGQFLLLGIRLENITGTLSTTKVEFFNAVLHAEYRNKTRNKLWDILARGEFYSAGNNAGDYSANAMLGRYLNKKWGNIRLFFTNVNRTPSFIFDNRSSFNFKNNNNFKKENILSFGAETFNSLFSGGVKNHLITNMSYFTNLYKTEQYTKAFSLLQVYASKKIKLKKKWNWYTDITLQQTDGAAPVKVPLLFTRNRIAFEGVFYKNLNLSTGAELRYYSPYKGYNYSPVMGQFVPQDSSTISNLPVVDLFLHFRIKSFNGFIRAENLNTISFKNGFGFTNNNFAALHQPTQGFIFRFGIKWGFVN
jgi:Putative porin